MAASGATTPAHLDRYLLGSERLVVAVRRHPARLVEPVGSAVLGLAAAGWLDTVATGGVPVLADVVWLAWVALVVRALWKLAEWRQDWFAATDQRLLLTYGLLTRKVAMMPLSKVTDLSYNRSPLGRVLGYGEFVLESAGQEQAMRAVAWLPSPDVLYRRICAELFDPAQDPRTRMNPSARPPRRTQRPVSTQTPPRTQPPHPDGPVDRSVDTQEVQGWEPPPDGTERPASWRARRSADRP